MTKYCWRQEDLTPINTLGAGDDCYETNVHCSITCVSLIEILATSKHLNKN